MSACHASKSNTQQQHVTITCLTMSIKYEASWKSGLQILQCISCGTPWIMLNLHWRMQHCRERSISKHYSISSAHTHQVHLFTLSKPPLLQHIQCKHVKGFLHVSYLFSMSQPFSFSMIRPSSMPLSPSPAPLTRAAPVNMKPAGTGDSGKP